MRRRRIWKRCLTIIIGVLVLLAIPRICAQAESLDYQTSADTKQNFMTGFDLDAHVEEKASKEPFSDSTITEAMSFERTMAYVSSMKSTEEGVTDCELSDGYYNDFGEMLAAANAEEVERKVYEFCRNELGLNVAASCGVLGNIYHESRFNPNTTGDNGTSYGLCQWHDGGGSSRWTQLKEYRPYDWETVDGQLAYLKHEFESNEKNAWNNMALWNIENTEEGAGEAGSRWAQYFERCAHYWCPVSKKGYSYQHCDNCIDQYSQRKNTAQNTFWQKYGDKEELEQDWRFPVPCQAYARNQGRVSVYASVTGDAESGHWIDGNTDKCTIDAVYTNGWCHLTYPTTSSGDRPAYVPLSEFYVSSNPNNWTADVGYKAYCWSSGSDEIGSVDSGDACTIIGGENGRTQVVYPVTGKGYYKMGWIEKSDPTQSPSPYTILDDYGNDFYAYIIAQDPWRHTTNLNRNVQLCEWNDCNDPRQVWHFVKQGDGSYKIFNEYDGGILDADGTVAASGANVQAYSEDNGGDNQRWYIALTNNGARTLISKAYQLSLDCNGGTFDPGTNIQVWEINQTNAQSFNIYHVTNDDRTYAKPDRPDKVNPNAPTGCEVGAQTKLSWPTAGLKSEFYDRRTYDVRIYKDDVLVKELFDLTDTSCSVVLNEPGNYSYSVATVNEKYYEWFQISDKRSFTVFSKPTDAPTQTPSIAPVSIIGNLANTEGIEEISLTTNTFATRIQKLRYGYSEQGRELICWSLSPETFDKTILMNFEIHGWEDEYAADGQVLVNLANSLVQYFSESKDLHRTRLVLIPSCNPDGLLEGTTNNGFGRCNSKGVDLNRDFDASYEVNTGARNYTEYPFSAKESRALRDLTLAAKPAIAIDFHGWENCVIGNKDLAEVFSTNLGLTHRKELTETAHGYFSYWAQLQGADAMLVEFKDSGSVPVSSVARAIEQLMEEDYGLNSTKYSLAAAYSKYPDVKTYAISDGKVYTQANVGDAGNSFGYVDGATDECTIRQIYTNGWCKLWYPVGSNTKTAYAQTSAFISEEDKVEPYPIELSQTTTVYTKPDGSTKYGSVWASDPVTVVAERGDWLQVIYPLDAGGYKMGWIARPESTSPTVPPTPKPTDPPAFVLGDVTGDGEVTIGDVVKINRSVIGRIQLTEAETLAADVTGDGEITIADVVKINRFVIGRITEL